MPGTRHEVQAIAELFRAEKGTKAPSLLLGSEASEQKLAALAESGRLKDFRYLHFATHGVMDDQAAMRSALILSQDNLPDAFERVLAGEEVYDGRLTAEQIVRTWKLDADLVTLSACETALGKRAGGEGFLGFAQALFVAGARSLVLSLWKVDDTATALLMHRFYENLLGRFDESREIPGRAFAPGEAIPKAEALREAKRWLGNLSPADAKIACRAINLDESKVPRGGPALAAGETIVVSGTDTDARPYNHPYYWAAFILLGDGG